MSTPPNAPILELRVAVTTADYERLLKFYTIGLGIEPALFWQNGQGHAAILKLGHATLEIFIEYLFSINGIWHTKQLIPVHLPAIHS